MKIVYIVQNKFTNRDYYRYGIEELIHHSELTVEIWDVSQMLYPKAAFNYNNFNYIEVDKRCHLSLVKSYEELVVLVSRTEILYCLSFVLFSLKTLKLFKILSENKVTYSGTGLGMTGIAPGFNYSCINTDSIWMKIYNTTVRRQLSVAKRVLFRIIIKVYGIKPYKFFFLSGGVKTDVDNILVSKATKKIRLHANNFDLHLKQYENYKNRYDYSYDIYIDQNVTNSSDSLLRGNKLDISSKKYYDELNVFLKKLNRITGRKIIVAAHPKVNSAELEKFLPDYEIVANADSLSLIYYSTNVIVSYSMAIGMGIFYNKDLILITNSDINRYKKPILRAISTYLKISYINISENYDIKSDLNFNRSMYSNYVSDFITTDRNNDVLFSVKAFMHMNASSN